MPAWPATPMLRVLIVSHFTISFKCLFYATSEAGEGSDGSRCKTLSPKREQTDNLSLCSASPATRATPILENYSPTGCCFGTTMNLFARIDCHAGDNRPRGLRRCYADATPILEGELLSRGPRDPPGRSRAGRAGQKNRPAMPKHSGPKRIRGYITESRATHSAQIRPRMVDHNCRLASSNSASFCSHDSRLQVYVASRTGLPRPETASKQTNIEMIN